MILDAEWILTAAGVLGVLGSAVTLVFRVHKWYLKQEEQNRTIAQLQHKHAVDIGRINRENQLIIVALSACLDGLMQLGANHSVPTAKHQLDTHLNQQAHSEME